MSREADRAKKKQTEADVVNYLNTKAAALAETQAVRKNVRTVDVAIKDALFLEQLKGSLSSVFKDKLPPPTLIKAKPLKKVAGKIQRTVNLILSDLHYGSDLDKKELGHTYGTIEESRRTASVCRQVAKYKEQYRDETDLHVHLIGDIINGSLHDPRDGAPVAEQVARAIRILVQAIRYLALAFPLGVTVDTAVGNHGRLKSRHHNRAVNQKFDAMETIIYFALKEALYNYPNVKVNVGYTATYEFDMFGKTGYSTHGDTHLKPGFPSSSINVKSLDQQASKLNNSRVLKGKTPYSLFMVGHVHCGSMVHLPGGATVITNGCLLPPDAFAQHININDTTCGQMLFESVPGYIVGDSRFIEVTFADDVDVSLDKIIQPYTGLDA